VSSREFTFKWRSDSSDLQSDFSNIIAQTKRVQRALLQAGNVGEAQELTIFSKKAFDQIKQGIAQIERLKAALADINKFQQGRTANVPLPRETREAAGLDPERTTFTFEESVDAAKRLEEQIGNIEGQIARSHAELKKFNASLEEGQRLGAFKSLEIDFRNVEAQAKRVQRALLQAGETGAAQNLALFSKQATDQITVGLEKIERLRAALAEIAKFQQGRTANVPIPGQETRELAGLDTDRTRFTVEETERGVVRLRAAIAGTEQEIAGWVDRLQTFNNGLIQSNKLAEELRNIGSVAVQREAQRAASPESLEASIRERLNTIDRARNQLLERQAALTQKVFRNIDPSGQAKVQKQLTELREREARALQRVQEIQAQRVGIEERLNQLGSARVDKFLQSIREGQSVDQAELGLPGIDDQAQADIQRFTELTRQLGEAQQNLLETQREAARPREGFEFAAQRAGVADELERVKTLIGQLDREFASFSGPGRLDEINKIAPNLLRHMGALIRVTNLLSDAQEKLANDTSLTRREQDSLSKSAAELAKNQQRLVQLTQEGRRRLEEHGTIQPFNFDDIQGQLGILERTLIGAFRGFGRRFQATLQFSISAALIFGTQRFARELLDTAIEVERAFEDIATALEFNISAPRGTAGFRRELEGIRREVLDIADEFNVLPTLANEVAFKMVARFQDIGHAMEATRYQLLAIKVSTIDADEVLRALTATAEAFANEVLESNAALTLQERLLLREAAAIQNYARAVDLATIIQQKWGVDFEDTLEGVARAGPTFQSLGFTMQETAAIVASATRVLPGTGVQIAERLTRAFGSFTTSQIRDELLDLAATTDDLTLTMADFEVSGKHALQVIQSQIDQLDPKTLVEVQQIIGQRRELEVVSAVLGTADLQADINSITDAAGTAERRFSFLEATTRELINSVHVQFQEFAQNLERIGLLNPFKFLIQGAGLALDIINSLLRGVVSLIEALNAIPLVGFDGLGDALTTMLALGLAARSLLKTMEAIAGAQAHLGVFGLASATGIRGAGSAPRQAVGGAAAAGALTATQLGLNLVSKGLVRLSELFLRLGRGVGRTLDGMYNMAAALVTARGAILKNIAAMVAEARQRLSGAAGGFQASFLRAGGSAGGLRALGIGAALTGTAAAALAIKSALDASRDSLERHTETVEQSRRRIEAEAVARGLSFEETELEKLKGELEIAQSREDVGGIGNILQFALGDFMGDLDAALEDTAFVRALLEFNGIVTDGMGAEELRDAARKLAASPLFDTRQLIPGSAERNEIELAGVTRRLAEGFQKQFFEAFERLDFTGQEQARGFGIELHNIREAMEGASPEEVAALAPVLQAWIEAWEAFAEQHNLTLEGVEGTIKQMQEAVKRIGERVDIGEITPGQGLAEVQEIIDTANNLLDTVTDDREREAITDGIREFQQKQAELIRLRLDDARKLASATLSEEGAIRANIAALKRAVADFEQKGLKRAADEARLEILEAQKALNQFIFSQIQSQAQIAESLAGSPEETLRILREQKKELQRFLLKKLAETLMQRLVQGVFGGGLNLDFVKEIVDAINQVTKRIEDVTGDLNVRRAIARGRASGPILSNITRLKSEAAGLRERAKQVQRGTVEALEIMNSLNENMANQALEQLRAAQAYTLLQAGVNDVLKQTQAEMTNVAREIALAAKLYGSQSAEVFELKKRQQTLRQALIAYHLELADLNRRLDATDLTNTLEAAELELFRIAQELAAPDLGPLEKARLELEKKQAEIAHERAFFDDRLFQLQFLFETGAIGSSAYVAALQRLLEEVDTSTRQGKEIFLEIQGLIDGMTDDISDMQFNVPTSIRLPTLFEIRRSLAADQLGVNYQDNRQQDIDIHVDSSLDLEAVLQALLGAGIDAEAQRLASGGAGITIGAF
jgi:hypothetical protein